MISKNLLRARRHLRRITETGLHRPRSIRRAANRLNRLENINIGKMTARAKEKSEGNEPAPTP